MNRTGIILGVLMVVGLANSSHGDVIVNEVMANEPGASISLQWIELYNSGAAPVPLDNFFQLQIGASTLPLTGTILGQGYFIVCRRLFSSGGTPGFEEIWGNNSGVWGDDPREQFPEPLDTTFSLANGGGTVELLQLLAPVSTLSWSQDGQDGYSWERQTPTSQFIGQSIDPSGSTPARLNSLVPLPDDLSLDSVQVAADHGLTVMAFFIRNNGRNTQTNRTLTVSLAGLDLMTADTIVFSDSLPPIDSGFVTLVQRVLTLPGVYVSLHVALEPDDRTYNDSRDIVAPGDAYPPLRLSELLANPAGVIGTEWIELHNRLDSALVLQNWWIGDAGSMYRIDPGPVVVAAQERFVLAEDSSAFRSAYPAYQGMLVQPTPWPALNDGGDTVRLVDSFGILADQFAYQKVFEDNHTWCRGEEPPRLDDWGKSTVPGGSPGAINDVVFEQDASGIRLSVQPELFSPDGDGQDEQTSIIIAAPSASGYDLKIYDRKGRLVRTLVDNEQFLRDEYEWNGRSDGGVRLPIGLYIVYFEAKGVESVKRPVVIAR
ncbi:MAG: lamin tail domain-containing protein [Candidatus Zixiibacteriota bacterium]